MDDAYIILGCICLYFEQPSRVDKLLGGFVPLWPTLLRPLLQSQHQHAWRGASVTGDANRVTNEGGVKPDGTVVRLKEEKGRGVGYLMPQACNEASSFLAAILHSFSSWHQRFRDESASPGLHLELCRGGLDPGLQPWDRLNERRTVLFWLPF